MKTLFITPLSKLQITLYTALTLAIIAGGVFISSKDFRQTAYVAGSCLFPDEVSQLVAQKSSLESQAASLQAEIEQTQANIVNDSSFVSTTIMRIAELQSGILSDYALYLEEQNLNQICSQSSSDSFFSCGGIGDSNSCANTQGCLWGGGTSGYCANTSQSCSNMGDSYNCANTQGCLWGGGTGGYCSGSLTIDCSNYHTDQGGCESSSGCSWVYNETNSTYSCSGSTSVSCGAGEESACSSSGGCSWTPGAPDSCYNDPNISCSSFGDGNSCGNVYGCAWSAGPPDSCYNDPNTTSNSNTTSSCPPATESYNNLVAENNAKKAELASLESGTQTDSNLTTELDQKNAMLSDITTNQIPALDQAINNAVSCSSVYEECGNGVDDDRDGLTDCESNACSANPECQGGTGTGGNTETCWDSNACNPGASGACEYDSCKTDGGGNTAVSGCTNSSATNYDASATQDDGSCSYGNVYGCTDSNDPNYNSSATVDDGTCTYSNNNTGDVCDTMGFKWQFNFFGFKFRSRAIKEDPCIVDGPGVGACLDGFTAGPVSYSKDNLRNTLTAHWTCTFDDKVCKDGQVLEMLPLQCNKELPPAAGSP